MFKLFLIKYSKIKTKSISQSDFFNINEIKGTPKSKIKHMMGNKVSIAIKTVFVIFEYV